MTATGQNFEMYQGDDKQIIITAKDTSGNIIDLTGYDAVWVVYDQTVENVVLMKSTQPTEGITIPTPANGEIVIELVGDDTSGLLPKLYGHQCEIQDVSGHHSTVTVGFMKVLKSITHSLL